MRYKVSVSEMPVVLPDRTIYGKAFFPEGKAGRLPAVILSHGYNSPHEDLADAAYAFAETGAFAYCYDFCGGSVRSRSSGSSLDMSVMSEISDLKEVISYVRKLDTIDGENIFLYGESQGGFVSALTADESIKGLFLLYPAFCIPDNWKDRRITDSIIFMGMRLSRKFCDGLPDGDVYDRIKDYGGRVFIFHGDADSIVDISYSEKAVRSFKNASLDVFPGEGHGFSNGARKKMIGIICGELEKIFCQR